MHARFVSVLPFALATLAVEVTAPATGAADLEPALVIDQGEQLFLDDYLLATRAGVMRRVQPLTKSESPVIKPTLPWEQDRAVLFGSVLREPADGPFRMWYYAGGHMGYATSPDGIAWTKPAFDWAPVQGKSSNLVMWRGPEANPGKSEAAPPAAFGRFYENFGVILDPRDPDPARRYKTAFVSIQRNYEGPIVHPNQSQYGRRNLRGMGTAVSPDGLRWKLENDFASHAIFDIGHILQEEAPARFVIYGRSNLTPENNRDGRWVKWGVGRAVTRIESADFRTWSEGEIVLAADRQDPPNTEIYSMAVFRYGAIYIGLVQMYYHIPGRLEIQLAVSRDGRTFSRVEPRHPFLAEGKEGAWDQYNISVGDAPPIAFGNNLWFYYGGRNFRHSGHKMEPQAGREIWATGVASMKRGRFVALTPSGETGTIITKPLRLPAGRLTINAAARSGRVGVTLLDEQWRALPGFDALLAGPDSVSFPVTFAGGDLSALAGKAVRIRFELSGADLYGFQVTPSP